MLSKRRTNITISEDLNRRLLFRGSRTAVITTCITTTPQQTGHADHLATHVSKEAFAASAVSHTTDRRRRETLHEPHRIAAGHPHPRHQPWIAPLSCRARCHIILLHRVLLSLGQGSLVSSR